MRIRREQIRCMEQEAMRRFTTDVSQHFREALPDHYRALGEAGTAEAIAEGVARAKRYGIVTERGAFTFIQMMFLFGRNFDTNPDLPWARRILDDPSITNGAKRAARLAEACLEYLTELSKSETDEQGT